MMSDLDNTLTRITNQILPVETAVVLLYNMSEHYITIIQYNTAIHPIVKRFLNIVLDMIQSYNVTINKILSPKFLDFITDYVVGTVNGGTHQVVDYEFKLSLWQMYLPSYESMLLEIVKLIKERSESQDVREMLAESEIDKACSSDYRLYIYTIDYFKSVTLLCVVLKDNIIRMCNLLSPSFDKIEPILMSLQ
jgi:hypothetical protein